MLHDALSDVTKYRQSLTRLTGYRPAVTSAILRAKATIYLNMHAQSVYQHTIHRHEDHQCLIL